MNMPTALRTLNAEVRGIESGRVAVAQPDGSFHVGSTTTAHRTYRITYFGDTDGLVRFSCSCDWGRRNPSSTVGCAHAALAGRSLVRRGFATQDSDGLFHVPAGFVATVEADTSDPFAGLPS